jgi:transcription initiation factor TFIIF subunit alpha
MQHQRPNPYGFQYQQYAQLNPQQQQQVHLAQQGLNAQQAHHFQHAQPQMMQQQAQAQMSRQPQPQPAQSQPIQNQNYTEYRLVASSDNVPHHILKFHGRKKIDVKNFTPPVRLHRKQLEQNTANLGSASMVEGGDEKDGKAGDGKQTFTEDLKEKAEEPTKPKSQVDTSIIAPFGGGAKNKQQLFKRRTKQIIEGDKESRMLREQEGTPWVLEDFDSENVFVGNLQGGQRADYMLFLFTVT